MKIDGTDNLVDEWGFTDVVGTRYYVDDYYGERFKVPQSEAPLRMMVRRAWYIKPEYTHLPIQAIKSEMVELLFPEKLSFKSLRQKLSKNERMFRCQQLNEPAGDSDAFTFDEDVLKAHLINAAPLDGTKYITWDTSYARDTTADYSAGVCSKIVQVDDVWEMYIVEIIFGKWKPSELVHHMIQFELKHRPKMTLIEEMNGAEFLKADLQRLAQVRQCPLNMMWQKASPAADAKRNRIKSLETLLKNHQMFFVAGAWIDETFNQFMRYTGERKNKGRKDDIPDAIAYQQFFLPTNANNEEMKKAQAEREEREKQKAYYDRYFTPASVPVPKYEPPSIKRQLFGSLAHG
jgi:predicted phage terminase large subunit-like protein